MTKEELNKIAKKERDFLAGRKERLKKINDSLISFMKINTDKYEK
jgi:hypothetical protein